MFSGRALARNEINAIWTIDRREVIDAIYCLEDGALVLKTEHFDVRGWPPGEAETYTPLLEDCFDHGGWFYGLFDAGRLIGVTVLENRFIGRPQDQLQLKFLHLSHGYRDQGLGRRLFELAADEARRRGARRLYISATPSQHTIDFYLSLGCTVTAEPDPELFALEPGDIHLEYDLTTSACEDYTLLDSGGGRKLERFGPVTLIRPEAQAAWQPALPAAAWDAAHAVFQPAGKEGGRWAVRHPLPPRWEMRCQSLRFWVQASESRQVGVFPENAAHWQWIADQVRPAVRPLHVLNLFGYTGLASLTAAQAGAQVTHVDASKKVVVWARENQALSGLQDRPIRWIVEDALTYLRREQRRGVRYDGIVLDPPAFGRGPAGEVWTFDRLFDELCLACRAVLSRAPLFVVATVYTKGVTTSDLHAAVAAMLAGLSGTVELGELTTVERSAGRVLHNALYARWRAD